jgi:ferredoxin/flavodoxin---NADP+ reductase
MLNEETVLSVHHWTDTLFSFKTTREPSFRFSNGHFTMLGIPVNGKPLLRAYSIASPNYADHLEFFSIKVKQGPLTSRLQHLKAGDKVLVSRKPTGTLVTDYLLPGKRLYLLATGTGLAPFLSVIKDPETLERYETIVLVHGCRVQADLAYRQHIEHELPNDELLGELIREKLRYYPTLTREQFLREGRIPGLLANDTISQDLGLPALSAEHDRIMICGSPGLLSDLKPLLNTRGFTEGSTTTPGHYVVERAFVEKS